MEYFRCESILVRIETTTAGKKKNDEHFSLTDGCAAIRCLVKLVCVGIQSPTRSSKWIVGNQFDCEIYQKNHIEMMWQSIEIQLEQQMAFTWSDLFWLLIFERWDRLECLAVTKLLWKKNNRKKYRRRASIGAHLNLLRWHNTTMLDTECLTYSMRTSNIAYSTRLWRWKNGPFRTEPKR